MQDHMTESTLTRGELARATDCHIETIRYYEKIGMLPNPPRTLAGHRVYSPPHVSRLRFVLRGRELGFSVEDIRGLLGLGDGAGPTCTAVKARTERHLADIRERIADLQRIEATLAATAAQCSGEAVPDCPVLDALSRRGRVEERLG